MIWNSTGLMTAIDVLIAGVVVFALYQFHISRARIREAGASRGVAAVGAGLLILAGFYLTDLWAMWVLPDFVPMQDAMARMRWLHLNGGFIVSTVSVALIVVGFIVMLRANHRILSETARALSALQEELRTHTEDRAALDEARQRLDAAFAAGGIGMFIADGEGRFTEVNQSLCRIFGYDESELIGKTRRDLTHPDDLADTLARLEIVRRGGDRPPDVEKRFIRKDGSVLWAITNGTHIYGADGSLENIVGTVLDITDRKNAADELSASEERFSLVMDAANAGIWDRDLVTGEGYFSPRWKAIFGYGPDERAPEVASFSDLTHPDDRERVRSALDEHLRNDTLYDLEVRLRHKDGHFVWVRARGQAVRDENGKPVRMAGSIVDIQDRKLVEEQLRESEERYRRLIEESEFGIRIEQPGGKHLFINHRCVEMFGFDSEAEYRDAISVPGALIAPHDRKRLLENMRVRVSGGEAQNHYEYDAIRKDGSYMPVEIFVRPITWEGEPAYQRTFVDITGRREAEREIRELNQALEARVEARTAELRSAQAELLRQERLATLGQLAATVSHEIRNPIGAIAASTDVISAKVGDADLGVAPALDRIRRSIARCERIISEMLDYARDHSARFEHTNLDDWLASVLDDQPTYLGIEICREFRAGDAEVEIDRDLLRRAVINLYDNALDAMASAKGRSEPESPKLVVKTRMNADAAEICISDNGPGIPQEDLGKIFEPLFSTKSFGVGLGLPVVKKIVDQHNGTIGIDSDPGKGTTISVRIPPRHAV